MRGDGLCGPRAWIQRPTYPQGPRKKQRSRSSQILDQSLSWQILWGTGRYVEWGEGWWGGAEVSCLGGNRKQLFFCPQDETEQLQASVLPDSIPNLQNMGLLLDKLAKENQDIRLLQAQLQVGLNKREGSPLPRYMS